MRLFLLLIIPLSMFSFTAKAQTGTERDAILQRLDNAADYTLKVLVAMPEADMTFQPGPGMRSFAELFQHIGEAQLYTAGEGIKVKGMKYRGALTDQAALAEFVSASYASLRAAMAALEPEKFAKMKSFWSGKTTVGHILNFTLDHATHHRGQATTYLRLKGIKPPDYIGW